MNSFAIVDVETTGFGKYDRILEIAIVHVDGGRITREWETLINPNRDISNSFIHGITAELVSLAPIFDEIAEEVSYLLNDRIFVAHNINFDARMIEQEFNKLDSKIDLGEGLCTLQMTKMKLEAACESFGVVNSSAHRALADARATAEILLKMPQAADDCVPVSTSVTVLHSPARTLTRDAVGSTQESGFEVRRRPIPDFNDTGFSGAKLSYLDAVSIVLSDLELDKDEAEFLRKWAEVLGLSKAEQGEVHQQYVQLVIKAAERDGVISDNEKSLILKISQSLGVQVVEQFEIQEISKVDFFPGARVCFTGEYRNPSGILVDRSVLEELARNRGLAPVGNVTKKYCDMVIAAEASSMSGKAKKARELGFPVKSVADFLMWCDYLK